jgi:hypothetical protein
MAFKLGGNTLELPGLEEGDLKVITDGGEAFRKGEELAPSVDRHLG